MDRTPAAAVRRAATSRRALAVFAALLLLWAGFEADAAPDELFVPLVPALAAGLLLDTAAYNHLGIRVPWSFYPLTAVCLYVEAVCIASVVRLLRRRRSSSDPHGEA